MFLRPPSRLLLPLLAAALAATAPLARAAGASQSAVIALSPEEVRAAGIELVAPRPAAEGGLRNLPARVGIPNAQQRVVGSPVAGVVVELLVAPGDAVKQGQVLARIASPELLGLRRELAQAEAERELARKNRVRDEALYAEGIIAEARLQASRTAERVTAAAVLEKAGVMRLAGARAGADGTLALLAPISGIVLEQSVRTGTRLDPAAPVFHLAQLVPLSLDIEVPAASAGRLAPGLPVAVARGGARGKVVAVGRAVGEGQTVTVRALLTDNLAGLNPGQLVEAAIEAPAGTADATAWRLPAAALVRMGAGGGAVVFVQRPEGFVPVAAKAVGEGAGEVVLEAPLTAADRVVAKGASTLKAVAAGVGQGE